MTALDSTMNSPRDRRGSSDPAWFRTWIQRFASSSAIERDIPRQSRRGQPLMAVLFLCDVRDSAPCLLVPLHPMGNIA